MKTTLQVEIEKKLRSDVKIAAAECGIPMKEFVTEALNTHIKSSTTHKTSVMDEPRIERAAMAILENGFFIAGRGCFDTTFEEAVELLKRAFCEKSSEKVREFFHICTGKRKM